MKAEPSFCTSVRDLEMNIMQFRAFPFKENEHSNRLSSLLRHSSQLEVNISRFETQSFCIAYFSHNCQFSLSLKVNYLLEFQQIETCSRQFETMKCLCEHNHFLNISGQRSKPNVADFLSNKIANIQKNREKVLGVLAFIWLICPFLKAKTLALYHFSPSFQEFLSLFQ